MLHRITCFSDVNERKLMDIYTESNYENTEYFYPDETDKEKAVKKVEVGFLDYLKSEFLTRPENTCWVLEEIPMMDIPLFSVPMIRAPISAPPMVPVPP